MLWSKSSPRSVRRCRTGRQESSETARLLEQLLTSAPPSNKVGHWFRSTRLGIRYARDRENILSSGLDRQVRASPLPNCRKRLRDALSIRLEITGAHQIPTSDSKHYFLVSKF